MKRMYDEKYGVDVIEKLIGPNVDPRIEEVYERWVYNGSLYESERNYIYEYLTRSRDSSKEYHDIVKYNRFVERLSEAISTELMMEAPISLSDKVHSEPFPDMLGWFIDNYYRGKYPVTARVTIIKGIAADVKIRKTICNFYLNKREYTDAELNEITALIYDTNIYISNRITDRDEYIKETASLIREFINVDTSIITKYDLCAQNLCEIMVDIIKDPEHNTEKFDEIVEFLHSNIQQIISIEALCDKLTKSVLC